MMMNNMSLYLYAGLSPEYIPRSGDVKSKGKDIHNFDRYYEIAFAKSCTNKVPAFI
jgi:hypothetical protein